ncbi:hypothetical protein [Azospirillum doebereinerae]
MRKIFPADRRGATAQAVRRVVARRTGEANPLAVGFSGHSLRVGAAQDLLATGVDLPELMLLLADTEGAAADRRLAPAQRRPAGVLVLDLERIGVAPSPRRRSCCWPTPRARRPTGGSPPRSAGLPACWSWSLRDSETAKAAG